MAYIPGIIRVKFDGDNIQIDNPDHNYIQLRDIYLSIKNGLFQRFIELYSNYLENVTDYMKFHKNQKDLTRELIKTQYPHCECNSNDFSKVCNNLYVLKCNCKGKKYILYEYALEQKRTDIAEYILNH